MSTGYKTSKASKINQTLAPHWLHCTPRPICHIKLSVKWYLIRINHAKTTAEKEFSSTTWLTTTGNLRCWTCYREMISLIKASPWSKICLSKDAKIILWPRSRACKRWLRWGTSQKNETLSSNNRPINPLWASKWHPSHSFMDTKRISRIINRTGWYMQKHTTTCRLKNPKNMAVTAATTA